MKQLVFVRKDGTSVPVTFDPEKGEIWMTRSQVARMFDLAPDNLSYLGRMLSETVSEMSETPDERERHVRTLPFFYKHGPSGQVIRTEARHYSLDAVLSVGYRLRGERGAEFRQWATSVIRDHLVNGFSLNHERLMQRGMDNVRKILDMAQRTFSVYGASPEAMPLSGIVDHYMRTWVSLGAYDTGNPQGFFAGGRPATASLDLDRCRASIGALRTRLAEEGTPLGMFGIEREEGLKRIVDTLDQEFFGEAAYPTVEGKAAHLLYFIVKDHPFHDGNKRVGTLLFLDYLAREGVVVPEADVAPLTLFVAGSDPGEKEMVIAVATAMIRNNAMEARRDLGEAPEIPDEALPEDTGDDAPGEDETDEETASPSR